MQANHFFLIASVSSEQAWYQYGGTYACAFVTPAVRRDTRENGAAIVSTEQL